MKPTRPPGFTLLELIITILIIAVVFTIAVPVIGRVREQGSMVKCVANLRALGTVIGRFTAENNGRLPPSRLQYSMDSSGNRRITGFLPDYLNRLYFDMPGVTQLNPLWWCPADTERPESMRKHSYGHNQHLGGNQASSTTWDGEANPDYDARYGVIQAVEKPLSEVIYLIEFVDRGDQKWSNAVTGGRWPMVGNSDPENMPQARIDFSRHRGVANALMLDGSVRGFRLNDLLHTGYYHFSPKAQ